ncbi:MAG: HEAT repeat domain-containing protein, partial [Candidatus Aminicenantes bacterium]|nr:HEAT repeat domain-containing protein [Candidatus Aminicenantes bacterium]
STKFNDNYFLTGYNFNTRGKNISFGTFITSSENRISKISHDGDSLQIYHYMDAGENHETGYKKRMVIFLHRISGKRSEVVNAVVLKGGMKYKIGDIPLYLLGEPDTDKSFTYVKNLFKSSSTENSKKRFISVIAIHDHKNASRFLYETASGDHGVRLRKTAIFWLGACDAADSFSYLKKLSDRSNERKIIKSLVFAFHNLNSKEGNRELIRLAKSTVSDSARRDAIFWLGQRASKEGIKTLKDVIYNDKDEDVRNSAVFALSQLDDDKSIPILIDIVRNNKNSKIKKKAMFWLGQKDDKRVVDLFESILLK